ncbi:glycosyltransferase family 32 protein [Horticoccus sp. 23ND18S-11]|uniref:glycosyltransferase family 32 protein n=1 Tax=Horticoccus sp. 23ND18S-11 TaxID=3391832 RepID=UPI0039C9F7DF
MASPDPIPRRIIQTGKNRIFSILEQAALAGLSLLNPGWEIVYFDDAEVEAFVDREFPAYRATFDGFPYRIQKYDFFRYLAVYRLGGFYFDLDVFLAKPLEELTRHSCVLTFEELTLSSYLRARGMDWEVGNYAFGASAGHPFLRSAIESCARYQSDPKWIEEMMTGIPFTLRRTFEVLNSTGPGMLTRTLIDTPKTSAPIHILLPADVCDEAAWHNFGDFGIHLMSATWRGQQGLLARRYSRWWESRERRRLMRESRSLGPIRCYPLPEPRHESL